MNNPSLPQESPIESRSSHSSESDGGRGKLRLRNPNAPQLLQAADFMEEFETPPGTDREFIMREVPSAQEIIQQYIVGFKAYHGKEEALSANGLAREEIEAFANAPGIRIDEIMSGSNHISKDMPPNGRIELKKHWKRLVDTAPKNAIFKVVGDKVLVNYEIGKEGVDSEGNSIRPCQMHVLFDLSERVSSKNDGLKVAASFTEDGHGNFMDNLSNTLPGTSVYFKKVGWLVRLIGNGNRIAGINDKGVEINRLTADGAKQEGITSYVIYHEDSHVRDLKDRKLSGSSLGNLAYVGLYLDSNIAVPVTAVAALFGASPWWFIGATGISLVGYILSRYKGNPIGDLMHKVQATEIKAYYTHAVIQKLLESNGFATSNEYSDTPENRNNWEFSTFYAKYLKLIYQPVIWALIDSFRSGGKSKRMSEREFQPLPSPVAYHSLPLAV